MKIFALHNHNKTPGTPLSEMPVSCLPDTALLNPKGPFFIPLFTADCRPRLCAAVRIERLGKGIDTRFARRYYHPQLVSPAAHLVAQDCLDSLSRQGLPWDTAVGYDSAVAAAIAQHGAADGEPAEETPHACLALRVGTQAHTARIPRAQLLEEADRTIARLSRLYTLRQGDLILLPLLADLPPVRIGDRIALSMDGTETLAFNVR